MPYRPKVALVTGGAGFIGRRFCKRLISLGYYTVCVDNLSSITALSPNDWPEELNCEDHNKFLFFQEDCREFFKTEDTRFDIVIHLAAVTENNRTFITAENLSIDSELFTWLGKIVHKPQKVLYFSSDHVTSNDPEIPKNIDLDKLTGEHLARIVHGKYGINIACCRLPTCYSETLEDAHPFTFMLKHIILSSSHTVNVDLSHFHNMVNVVDIVETIVADIANKDSDNVINNVNDGSTISIGTEQRISELELAHIINRVTGFKGVINSHCNNGNNTNDNNLHQYEFGASPPKHIYKIKPRTSLETSIAHAARLCRERKKMDYTKFETTRGIF